MKFSTEFTCDSGAFGDDPRDELLLVLERIAAAVNLGNDGGPVKDSYGDTVGQWSLTEGNGNGGHEAG